MQRRLFIRNSSLALAGLAFLSNKTFAQLLADPTWKIKMLTDTIGVFTEKGGTIVFMIGKEGLTVVDAQFPEQSQHLIDELKKRSQLPFELLINTHHHGDHTAGNISFKGLVKNVLAHENSKANQERVAKEKKNEDQQYILTKLMPTPGANHWAKKKSACTILAQHIPMAIVLFILKKQILCIQATWFLTVAILLLTDLQELILKAG